VRLAEAVQALGEAHALMVRLCDPDAPLSPALETAAATAGAASCTPTCRWPCCRAGRR
jgi:hypothetical protein